MGLFVGGVVAGATLGAPSMGTQAALFAPLILVWLVLTVAALADLARRREVRGSKVVWALVIVIVATLGPITYFVVGRRDG